MAFTWSRRGGYEVSTKGDKRFSALVAKMPDGRTIEQWYQCDVKGYDIGGTNWKLGKGKPPAYVLDPKTQWEMYLNLWKVWALTHKDLIMDLHSKAVSHGGKLSDRFANSDINQARALAQILNEWG